MERDIAPELLEKVLESFDDGIKTSSEFKWALNVMESKSADYKTAHEFSKEVGIILSEAYKLNITSEILPNGKMYFNIADRVVRPTMEKAHEIVSEYTTKIQTQLNYKVGLKIKGLPPEINEGKVYGIVDKLTTIEKYEDIAWVLDEPIKNFCQSIVEDTINTNVNHHYKLGLKPKIIRISSGNCCDWCNKLARTYRYPDVPKDVYRRHLYCNCTVEYHPGDGKKQNIHNKKWTNVEKRSKIEKRKKLSQKDYSSMSKVRKELLKSNIAYNSIIKSKKINSEKEIIKKLGGLDKTKGSCSSLAFAYIGNKAGYDVLDYRGGKSCDFFARNTVIKSISKLPGVKKFIERDFNDFKAINRLVKNMTIDKEYYLAIGKHAAIVRKTSKGFEYLELQNKSNLNGFKNLDMKILKNRFACQKSYSQKYIGKYEMESVLIEVDSLKNNEEFKQILGFINTDVGKEIKGNGGSIK